MRIVARHSYMRVRRDDWSHRFPLSAQPLQFASRVLSLSRALSLFNHALSASFSLLHFSVFLICLPLLLSRFISLLPSFFIVLALPKLTLPSTTHRLARESSCVESNGVESNRVESSRVEFVPYRAVPKDSCYFLQNDDNLFFVSLFIRYFYYLTGYRIDLSL